MTIHLPTRLHDFIAHNKVFAISTYSITLRTILFQQLQELFCIHRLRIVITLEVITTHITQLFCLFLCFYTFRNNL